MRGCVGLSHWGRSLRGTRRRSNPYLLCCRDGLLRFARNDGDINLRYTHTRQQARQGNPILTLHHLNDSRSQRILWLLEELGTPYEMKKYQRDATTRLAPPELMAVHPLGKSPVITDGNVKIAESGAIVDYLIRRYGIGNDKQSGKAALMPVPDRADFE